MRREVVQEAGPDPAGAAFQRHLHGRRVGPSAVVGDVARRPAEHDLDRPRIGRPHHEAEPVARPPRPHRPMVHEAMRHGLRLARWRGEREPQLLRGTLEVVDLRHDPPQWNPVAAVQLHPPAQLAANGGIGKGDIGGEHVGVAQQHRP